MLKKSAGNVFSCLGGHSNFYATALHALCALLRPIKRLINSSGVLCHVLAAPKAELWDIGMQQYTTQKKLKCLNKNTHSATDNKHFYHPHSLNREKRFSKTPLNVFKKRFRHIRCIFVFFFKRLFFLCSTTAWLRSGCSLFLQSVMHVLERPVEQP